LTIKNNIIHAIAGQQIVLNDDTSKMVLDNNLFGKSGSNLGTHYLVADPKFVGAGDFHVQPNSPACTGGENGTYIGAFPCGSVPPTATNTAIPATQTSTATRTPIPNTFTSIPATKTPTATAQIPTNTRTATPTFTSIPPTNTFTQVPATFSPTVTMTPTLFTPPCDPEYLPEICIYRMP
jgi:hypothetical protein